MKKIELSFQSGDIPVSFPDEIDIFSMSGSNILHDPESAIEVSLNNPIGTHPLKKVILEKKSKKEFLTAVVVISDNTRPVPYRGEQGILWPVVEMLLSEGIASDAITILVATGTHREMSDSELRKILDERIFSSNIRIVNHNCRDVSELEYIGTTRRGTEVHINSLYMQADIKILTGLVESHFMAGTSGGRKSICPGLIGENGTFIFHGPEMLDNPNSTDLVLEGNPCHEEALEVALMAGADFIVNVTIDGNFNLTGVFSGDLIEAHQAAVKYVVTQVGIPFKKKYDIVITHAGFVGINHYQAAKSGTAALRMVKNNGFVIMGADNIDKAHPVGAFTYRTTLQLLKVIGPDAFLKLIKSPDWTFIPEQWQVQMWCKLFGEIPMDHYYYFSPQFTTEHYMMIPGINGSSLGEEYGVIKSFPDFYMEAIEDVSRQTGKRIEDLSLCLLLDGPYGIPIPSEEITQ